MSRARPVFDLRDVHAGASIILVYGGRQQRIGGPLPGATAIANFLNQYRDDPGRPQPFGGRDDELRRLDEWLRTPEQPYLFLAAPPGRGKSALLARWCERLTGDRGGDRFQIVFVPVSIRFEFNRQETVLRAIATRLAAIHDEPAFGDSVDDWRDLVGELMLRAPPQGTRVLIVLDGLDEAAGWQTEPSLWPKSPHYDVKLVVSARLTATHPQPDDWMRDLAWPQSAAMELGPLSVEGVRDVLMHMGSRLSVLADDRTTVGRLHEISAGDPLVVGLYVEHLWANPLLAANATLGWLEAADPGLAGFIDRWWKDQERLWNDPAAAANSRRVFDLLACALGPLERRDLLGIARRAQPLSGDDLDAGLRALDRLVIIPSPRAYAVAHPRLGEYRLNRLREDCDLESLDRSFIDWAAESLERTRELPSPYVVRHYGQHLQRAQAEPERMTALLSPAWRSAWLLVTDDLTGWIDDINRVHAAAACADAIAVAAQKRPQWPALRAWCTCLCAEAGAIYDLVDGAFAAALVRLGLWSERRALTRCARVEDPSFRAEHLAALAPALSRDGARLAAPILRTLGDADRDAAAEAMVAVVARLVAEGDLLAAQVLAADSDSPYARAAGLLATFPALSEDERLEILRRLDGDGAGAHISQLAAQIDRELAGRAFGEPPWRYLERQLRGNVRWWPVEVELEGLDAISRAYALGSLAPWMTPAEREQQVDTCLDALAAYDWPYNVRDAVAALAPYLKGPAWHRVRSIAQDLLREHPQWQLLADIALLPYAPPGASAPLLEHLAKSVPKLLKHVGPSDISEALRTLAARGASAAVLAALSDLDDQHWDKADYLASVAPHLDLSGVHRALQIAAEARRETRPRALVALLARQAEYGEAHAALGASAPNDPDEVRAALSVLRVASGRQSFGEAVASLVAIEDRPLRVAAAAVAARLSPPTGTELLRVVSSFGDPTGARDVLPMEAFALVGGELRDEEWADADTLLTGRYMAQRGLHPRKGQIMVEHFRRFAGACGIGATLLQAYAYCTDTFDLPLAYAAVAVASQLEPGMELDRYDLVRAASHHTAVIMAATLGLLPPAARMESLGDAIEALGPADISSGPAGLLLGAVPNELYEMAASALIPDALLDGQSNFSLLDNWARSMAVLCPSLDAERLRRLLATSRQVSSGSARDELRAAIAVRLATLCEVEEALACVDQMDREQAAAALQQMTEVVTPATIPRLTEEVQSRVSYSYWRGPRALATAGLGRRIGELPPAEVSRLLDRWHARAPGRGDLLLDLLVYGPALLALGGPDTAGDLVDRLQSL